MTRRDTITEGHWRPIIDGATPTYGGFDYMVLLTDADEIVITGDDDPRTQKWLPHIDAAARRSISHLIEEYGLTGGMHLHVGNIDEHPIDTTPRAMSHVTSFFVSVVVRRLWVP